MKNSIRNILLALIVLSAGALQAASISGRISDLAGVTVNSATFVRFELKNCASNIPRVIGQTVIVPNVKDVVPNALGQLSGQVVGNDAIMCDVLGNTFYRVTVWNGKVKQFDQNFYVSGMMWDITAAAALNSDPTAVLTFNGYTRGDLLIASGTNQMSVTHGNNQSTRKFLGMSGDGTNPLAWDWYPLTPGDMPDHIDASKIDGLDSILSNSGMQHLPALTGDLNSTEGSTAPTVTGLRGRALSATAPTAGQVLQYSVSTGWTPATPAPGGVTSFAARTGAVAPAANDYSFAQISGTIGSAQLPASISATRIDGGLVSDASFGYLSGVTSPLQAQIDNKAALNHNHNFSALLGTIGDGQITSGINAVKIGTGSVDNLHLGYLAGVTSDLQAQLNSKLGTAIDLDSSGHVIRLQGRNVNAGAPAAGQGLVWDGSQWAPANIDASTVTLNGDVTGPATASVVTKVRGVTVAATAPTAGQHLVYSGGQWTPQAVSITASQVSDFATAADARISVQRGAASGLATLGADGKLISNQIPATVMNNSFVVASQVAQLALTFATGDVVIRSDLSKSYVHNSGTSGTMADFNELLSPTSPVQSVNGQTGNVSLSSTNINEGTNLYYTSARVAAAALGGDVTGTVGASSVIKLQGKAVSSAAPASGQVLKFDGTQWAPAVDAGSAGADALSIKGVTVAGTAPSTSQVLQYNGTNWAPATFVPSVSGDLTGNTGAAVVTQIQGRAVANTAPGVGQVLKWNGTQWSPDLDIGSTGANATSLMGVTISATAAVTGQIMQYNGSQWVPVNFVTDPTMGGDIANTAATAQVAKLRGRVLAATAPTNGQLLGWNNASSQWEPTTVTIPSTASSIQSVAVSATAPTTGQVLQYSGTQWAPATPITDPSVSGDLSGTASNAKVVKLQARTLSAATPANGQYIGWNGGSSQWEPTSLPSTFNAGQFQGVALASTAPVNGQLMQYNGAQWAPATVNTTNATSIQSIVVASTAPTAGQVLQYNGSQYVPATPSLSNANASQIQSYAVVAVSPTTGQALAFNGTSWAPTTLTPVPTTVGALTNDVGYLTAASSLAWAKVTGAPAFLTAASTLAWSQITAAPAFLTSVPAQTWASITSKPTAVSAWTNDLGYITSVPAQTWVSVTGKPTAVSYFANDAGYLTSATSLPAGTLNQVMTHNGTVWVGKDDARQFSYVVQDTANDLTTTTGSVADLAENSSAGTWTVLSVFCKSDSGSPTFNLSVAGTNLFSAAQTCTTAGSTFSTFASTSFASTATLSQTMVAAVAGNKRMSITVRYKQ